MNHGFALGRLFGIRIQIDWSWLFIFMLVLWHLTAVFGSWHEDWSMGLRLGLAFVAALLFFASVVAHELAHSLMARARGMEVRNITLFLFGGVSNIEREPPDPQSEFLIAIVGPLTSVVLGVCFLLAAGAMVDFDAPASTAELQQIMGQLGPLPTMLLWLGPINIILGVFNMLPGFPLDGGRILRSLLWAATGSLRRATFMASSVGQGIAWLLIVSGLAMVFGVHVPLLGTGPVGGLWLAFIGWFLIQASRASYRQLVMRDVLGHVPVARLMRRDPPTVAPDVLLETLVNDHLLGTDARAFPVLEGGRLVGLVSLDDVRRAGRDRWATATVADVMTSRDNLEVVAESDDVADAAALLARRDVNQLPVMDGARLVGLLRERDIMRWLDLHGEEGGR